MKKKFLKISVCLSFLFLSSNSYGGGFYLTEVGSPLSVGTAGVANVTNTKGPDAVYTNPAGMTALNEDSLLVGGQLLVPSIRFDSDSASAGGSDGGNAGSVAAIPSFHLVKKLNDDWSAGLGISAPFGAGVDYGSNFVGRYQAQKAELAGLGISPAVAYKVNNNFSIGVGVSAIYSLFTQEIAINQMGDDGQVKLDELDDWSFQGYAGLTYDINENTTLGFLYRTESDADLSGDVKFKNINNPIIDRITSQLNNGKVEYTYPQMARLGVKHKLNDRLTLYADVDWEDWSEFSKNRISLSGSGNLVNAAIIDRDWDDTYHVGLALSYQMDQGYFVTGGAGYDSSPVSDSKRTADIPVDEQLRLSFSYGKDFIEGSDFGFAFGTTFLWLGDGEIDQTAQNESFSGEFDENYMVFFSAALKYRF